MTEMQSMHSASRELEWSQSPPSNGAIASLHGEGGGAFDGPMGGPSAAAGPTGGAGGAAPGVSSFFSSPFASVGVEYGKTLLRDNSLLSGGLGGWLRGSRLRYYFRVSQQSTRRKMAKLLMPFVHYDWKRQTTDEADAGLLEAGGAAATGDSGAAVAFQPPSADINAPDLYLGSMAFVTFVVTMGFAMGSLNQFDPELIGMTATRSLVSLLLEVGCISALFYLSDAPQSPALLDLLSLCSYKYVALNIDILVGIILGPTPFWIVFLALAVSTAVFMLRTLNGWLPSSGAALGNPGSPRFRTMMLVSAGLQLAFSLFLLFPALPAVNASRGISGIMSVARAEMQPGGMLAPSSAAAAAAAAAAGGRTDDARPVPPIEPATPPLPAATKPAAAEPAAVAEPELVPTKPAPAPPAPSPAPGEATAYTPAEATKSDRKKKSAALSAGASTQSGRPARPANRRPPKDKAKPKPTMHKETAPASKP